MRDALSDLLYAKTESAFHHSLWDRYDVLSLLEFSSELEEMDATHREDYGRSFVSDAVFALGGCEPNLGDPLGKAWAEVIGTPQFQEIKGAKDVTGRAVAAMRLADMAREAWERAENPEWYTDTQPQDQVTGLTPSELRNLATGDGEEGAAMSADKDKAGEDGGWVGPVVTFGDISKALEELGDEMVLVRAIGASLNDDMPGRIFEKALDLADLFDVTEFAKMLGWAKHLIGGEARKQRGGTDEMTGYDTGRWNDRVVPDQMLGVAEGHLSALAAVADNALTRRKYEAKREAGRGPVILLRDESGSMGPDCGWIRHKAALSFELALAAAFNREGRDLISVAWSSEGTRSHVYGEPGLEEHLRTFLSGGTRIEDALEEGIALAEKYLHQADILVLTDGHLHTTTTTAKTVHDLATSFREGGGRVWAVSLSVTDNRLDWTDGHVHVNQIAPGEDLTDILQGMTRSDSENERRRL